MQHSELTPEIINEYKAHLEENSHDEYVAFDAVYINGKVHPDTNRSCYASFPYLLTNPSSADHCAVLYNGYNYPIRRTWHPAIKELPLNTHHSIVKGYGTSAKEWLAFLLAGDSPFRELFPFMDTTDPTIILSRKGFIFHNLTMGVNPSLLYTFISVARAVSEHPVMFQNYWLLRHREKLSKNIAAFISLNFTPNDYTDGKKAVWGRTNFGHGSPFNSYASWEQARNWINSTPCTIPDTGMTGCQNVFGPQKPNSPLPSMFLGALVDKLKGLTNAIEPTEAQAA